MRKFNILLLVLYIISPLLISISLLYFNVRFYISEFLFVSILSLYFFTKRMDINKDVFMFFIFFIFFICWVFSSVFYTESNEYFYEKVIYTINVVFCLFFLFYEDFVSIKRSVYHSCLAIILLGGFYFYIYASYISGGGVYNNLEILKGLYLNFGLITGLLFLCLYFWFEKNAFILLILVILYVYLLFSGARGPLVIVSLMIFFDLLSKGNIKEKVYLLFSMVFIGFFLIYIANSNIDIPVLDRTLERLSLLVSDDKGGSINTRLDYIDKSIHHINESVLLGHGYGSYGIVAYNSDTRLYPHNIILEVWFELGLLGVFLLLIILLYPFYLFFLYRRQKSFRFLVPYLYLLFNSLKSNTLTDHKLLFFFLVVSILYLINREKNND